MPGNHLTLYSRPGCHLCDEMKDVVAPIAAELGFALEVIDISSSAELLAAHGNDIPVLLVNDRKAFKHRLSARELRRRLARERG